MDPRIAPGKEPTHMLPTRTTVYTRQNIFLQSFRFAAINVKILKAMLKHRH